MNVGAALTRKIGPLPAWGWGVAVGGALLGVKMLRGGSLGGGGGTDKQVVVTVPTGTPAGGGDSGEFVSQLAEQLAQVRDQIADTDEATRSDWESRFEDIVDYIDDRFDDNADMGGTVQPMPSTTPPKSLAELLTAYEKQRNLTNASLNEYVVREGGLPLTVMRLRRALGMDPNQPTIRPTENTATESAASRSARLTTEYNQLSDRFTRMVA